MKHLGLVPLLVLALAAVAHAESDVFLSRDGNVVPGTTYLDSDGAVQSDKPETNPWDTFVEGEPLPADQFELPGFWPILETSPAVQTLVVGPTFRNQANRIEVGAGFAYVNSKWRFPFEFSVEPTYRRNKNVNSGDRDFSRVRTFGLVDLWSRRSDWESTSLAATGFWDTQSDSFDTLEFGGAVSQGFGRRLSLSADLEWVGDWVEGDSFNNAAVVSFGTSYNLGAGVRMGGFFEPDNNITDENDYGGFVSYQFLPFAELNVNAGKHEFVLVRLMISYALERP